MENNPTRVCELIVGLGDVEVLGVEDPPGGPLVVHIGCRGARPTCGGCGGAVWSKGSEPVGLVDLPAFGRPVGLIWRKRRWRCPTVTCGVGSFTEVAERIAPPRAKLTTLAGRWATVQVGRCGRPVEHVADELGCDWQRPAVEQTPGWSVARQAGPSPLLFCSRLTSVFLVLFFYFYSDRALPGFADTGNKAIADLAL